MLFHSDKLLMPNPSIGCHFMLVRPLSANEELLEISVEGAYERGFCSLRTGIN